MLSRTSSKVTATSALLRPQRVVVATASRSYAQPASSANTKPPVPLYGVDGTYASALYTAAAKSSALDDTARSLATLAEVFKKDARLPTLISAPTLTATDKSQIVQELQKHMGGADKGKTVQNFLHTMADNNRLSILEGVCEKFATLMEASRGEIELVITSAQKIDSKTLSRLETAIAKSEYSQGKKLKVVPKVNPDIKGGLIVEIGDRTIDLSVSNKIAKMNKLLTDAL